MNDDDHDLFNWITCIDDNCNTHRTKKIDKYFKKLMQYDLDLKKYSHDIWKTCQNKQCEKYIMKEIEYKKTKSCHEIFDWNFCENKQCLKH